MTNGEFEGITWGLVQAAHFFIWHRNVSSAHEADFKQSEMYWYFFWCLYKDPNIGVHSARKDHFYPEDRSPSVWMFSGRKVPDMSILGLVSWRCEAAATGTQTRLHACLSSRTFLTVALWWNWHSVGVWASPPRSYAGTLESGSALA